MNLEPAKFHAAGLRQLGDACLLVLAGRAGIGGISSVHAAEALRMPRPSVVQSFSRLVSAGLVRRPERDGRRGRPNRYSITPAGLELLQSLPETPAPPPQQIPIAL